MYDRWDDMEQISGFSNENLYIALIKKNVSATWKWEYKGNQISEDVCENI